MPLIKSNRDLDSTIIVVGIHLMLVGSIAVDALVDVDMSSLTNNLVIIYASIASYFFKSQKTKEDDTHETPHRMEKPE